MRFSFFLVLLITPFLASVVIGHETAGAATEKAEAEEKEEEFKTSDVGLSVSVMLIGGISFMMCLFYLVHNKDPDIKLYSWQVISQTISIFCAVLVFQGVNGIVEKYFLEEASETVVIVVDMIHLLVWFLLLQLVLAVSTGAIGETPESVQAVEKATKSWGIFFGHINAFAAINAFGAVQQLPDFSSNAGMTFLAVPMCFAVLLALYGIMMFVRNKVSIGDDDTIDDFEKKWDEETQDVENDIIGLAPSFLTVQTLRYAIGGSMPNAEGLEPLKEKFNHPASDYLGLLGCGLGFAALTCILVKLGPKGEGAMRPVNILQNFCSMAFAWCFFFGAKWFAQYIDVVETETILRAALALGLSFLSFILIFGLDKIADLDATGAAADEAIRTIIVALGVLVGFSWEQSFDIAIESVCEHVERPVHWVKLVISCFLVLLTFPAWRMYILEKTLELSEGKEKKVLQGEVINGEDEELTDEDDDEVP